ncbi:hypothetical protein GCM10010401_08850 [Rarobacter faecitabidus]|uniref:Uncharacterized protein n=1 Tax=Rarobacter faecitabidus TaxID=13243 RepID=A0A542ZB00_RARFA|nr:hypothetical protein FB461_2223 [Rarobacter faecitabidus]
MPSLDSELLHGPGGAGTITAAEFHAGVDDQRTWIKARLAAFGNLDRLDEVMAAVRADAWESLPRWEERGCPKFAAWCNGVAVRSLATWRRHERKHETNIGLDDLPPGSLEATGGPSHDDDRVNAARVIALIRARVMAKPGGVATWDRLSRDALKPEAGIHARQALLAELTALQNAANSQRQGDVA